MPKLYSGHVRCFVMNSYLKDVLKEVQVLVSHVNDVAHVTENMEQRGRHGLTRIFSTRSLQPPPVSTSIAVPGACLFRRLCASSISFATNHQQQQPPLPPPTRDSRRLRDGAPPPPPRAPPFHHPEASASPTARGASPPSDR
jgi:hypothetical protein